MSGPAHARFVPRDGPCLAPVRGLRRHPSSVPRPRASANFVRSRHSRLALRAGSQHRRLRGHSRFIGNACSIRTLQLVLCNDLVGCGSEVVHVGAASRHEGPTSAGVLARLELGEALMHKCRSRARRSARRSTMLAWPWAATDPMKARDGLSRTAAHAPPDRLQDPRSTVDRVLLLLKADERLPGERQLGALQGQDGKANRPVGGELDRAQVRACADGLGQLGRDDCQGLVVAPELAPAPVVESDERGVPAEVLRTCARVVCQLIDRSIDRSGVRGEGSASHR